MSDSEEHSHEPNLAGYLFEKEKRITRKQSTLKKYGHLFPRLSGGLLEIGCGHGHWLTAYAEQHPKQFCIGVDLLNKRIQKSSSKVNKRELDNIVFIKSEAVEFLELLPEDTALEKVMILFPDPWPKTRHHRRRIIQPEVLALIANKMQPGGKLFFRTDDAPYYDWTIDQIRNNKHWTLDEQMDWPMELPTYFQIMMKAYQSLSATVVR